MASRWGGESMGRRPKGVNVVVTAKQAAYCLKHLQDATALQRSTLVSLPLVGRIASERYRGSHWGPGCALRDLVVEICRRMEPGMEHDPGTRRLVTFLVLSTRDVSISQIARELGVSRSTIYRSVMPAAFALLAEELSRNTVQQSATVRDRIGLT